MQAAHANKVVLYGITLLLILLTGCAGKTRHLMPAPNLYTQADAPELFTDLPDELKSNQIDLLYITDRVPETDKAGELSYGFRRSRSAAFGSAMVTMNPDLSWGELVQASLQAKRKSKLTLDLTSVTELGRFSETPLDLVMIDGRSQVDPEDIRANLEAEEAFRQEILRRLALSPKDELLVFVHGFNNDFDDAAYTAAELWHYLGREYVPVIYTWPAGRGGPSGYIYDRESGEFTVHHLKNVIRRLSAIQEIKSFHLIAHSRGTDVTTSAVREIALAARAAKTGLPDELSGSHIILAAPDLDMDVVSQRIIAEELGRETKNITIYTSSSDKAIGLAEHFFKSVKRLGRLTAEDMSKEDLASMETVEGFSIVEIQEVSSNKATHGYFHSDPAASSDLILMIRYGRDPGVENGRPLKPVVAGFWQLEPGYPHPIKNEE